MYLPVSVFVSFQILPPVPINHLLSLASCSPSHVSCLLSPRQSPVACLSLFISCPVSATPPRRSPSHSVAGLVTRSSLTSTQYPALWSGQPVLRVSHDELMGLMGPLLPLVPSPPSWKTICMYRETRFDIGVYSTHIPCLRCLMTRLCTTLPIIQILSVKQ